MGYDVIQSVRPLEPEYLFCKMRSKRHYLSRSKRIELLFQLLA